MMITILVIVTLALTNALEPQTHNSAEVKNIISKYFANVPDIESRYVLNEGLSKAIWRYFKGKVHALPLFKIQLKIDRNPVIIPWELQENNNRAKIKDGKRYRIMKLKSKRRKLTTLAEITPDASTTDVSTDTSTTESSTDTTAVNVPKTESVSTKDISTTDLLSTNSAGVDASSTDVPTAQPSRADQPNIATSSVTP